MADERQLLSRAIGGIFSEAGTILAATSTVDTKPTTDDDGVSVKGLGVVDLLFEFSVTGEGCEVRVWLKFGTTWYASDSTKTITGVTGVGAIVSEPFATGSGDAIFIELVTAPATGTVAVKATPQGEKLA